MNGQDKNVKQTLATRSRSILSSLLYVSASLLLTSCMVNRFDSENLGAMNQEQRIKFLVIHATGKNYQGSVSEFSEKKQASVHYLLPESYDHTYLDDELNIVKLVNEDNLALHTANSAWQDKQDINEQSIGIAMVNMPKCDDLSTVDMYQQHQDDNAKSPPSSQTLLIENLCFFPDYDPKQIALLVKLSKDILKANPDISPTHVVGHSDIAPSSEIDPGPRFPWYQLYQAGIGAWYEQSSVEHYAALFSQAMPKIGLVQLALKSYGYPVIETGEFDQQTQDVLHAFQTHFLPWQVNNQADEQTAATLFSLLDKYMPQTLNVVLERYQKESNYIKKSQVVTVKNGQIDQVFPEKDRSTRELVNDRGVFKSYQGRGEIIIDNKDATSADIYINGEKLNITEPLQAYNSYQYSLKRRTKKGENTFKIENVLPKDTSLQITIPYPTLEEKSQQYKHMFTQVDALINDDVEQGFPGAVLVVVKDGKIIKKSAYGYSRKFSDEGELLSDPVKMDTQTLFDLASNTKMFATNFALMSLVSEGKLDISLPINHYLPSYRGSGRETITVKDILTHQAGYSPQVKFYTRDNALSEAFFSQDDKRTKDLILTKVPLEIGRAVKNRYSDTDYILLGMLIEKITHMPLNVYVRYKLYYPLGLTNTLFNPLHQGFKQNQFAATEIHGTTRENRVDYENIRTTVIQGEVHDENAYHSLAGVAGHAGLFSTGEDLAVLAQVLLNRGGYGDKQLFSANVLDQFIKPDDENGTYGLGWRRANHGDRKWHFGPYASASAFGHTGWTGTVTIIDPEHDMAIILLTNARHSDIEGDDKHYEFKGKQFETGKYGSVISLIYEAVLANF